jgi:aminoglycoside 3-N-acetyltransferase
LHAPPSNEYNDDRKTTEAAAMPITKERLKSDLRRLGLAFGDAVYAHTSLKSIGWIDGGPDTLIEAFLEALGPGGTLAVPSHTCVFPDRSTPYDPGKSTVCTGAFPEHVRLFPGAVRSAHPSHSSVAVGAKSQALMASHSLTDPFGYDSPLHRLYRTGGKVLLLGVGHAANTSLHLAESLAGMPYVRLPYDAALGEPYISGEGGAAVCVPQEQYPGCSSHFGVMEGLLAYRGIIKYGVAGNAVCQLMDMKEMVDCAAEVLKQRPDFLLCHQPRCPACGRRRALLVKNAAFSSISP